ncbi:MAG: amino acid permease [Acidobacteriota bacterium]|nr:amino acid permease [Acidobacteriota bacterium]
MPRLNSDELIKGLGPFGATSVVAGTMIGTAIFVVPSLMLGQAGNPTRVLEIWGAAGILSLLGALGYSELGAAIPEAGGEYVYLRRAFGPGLGFLYGWTQLIVAKTTSIATISTGFVLYLAYFFPHLSGYICQLRFDLAGRPHVVAISGIQAGAAIMIVLLSIFNVFGVRGSGALQTIFTAAKIAVLAVLIVLGLALGHGSWSNLTHALGPGGAVGAMAGGYGLAMVSALWGYDGWNNLSMVAGEVKNPERNMPLALIGGTILTIGVYLLVNIAYFYVLTPHEALSTRTIAADAARHFLGGAGGTFVAVGVLISTFATLNGSILSGSRIPYAQARDGLFPARWAKLSPRFRTPVAAIAAQAVVAAIFALSGSYETLYTKAIYSEWVFYALTTAGIFVLRRREPELKRPYKTWGYPVVPAVFVIVAVGLLIDTYFTSRESVLWCLALIGSGIPAYYLWKLWSRPGRRAQPRAGR